MEINKKFLSDWLKIFKKAWEEKNFKQIEKIFSKIENYYESKDSLPVKSVSKVLDLWEEVKEQEIKKLNFKIVSVKNNNVKIGWIFEDQSGIYEGFYKIKFNKNLECIEFRQICF